MAVNTKAIKSRIISVKNTKKITKAMQMIAAVKMKKSVDSAVLTRDYSKAAIRIMNKLMDNKLDHPLIENREVKTELLIIITSNRGLCGGYNAKVTKLLAKYYEESDDKSFKVIAIGKKGAKVAKRLGMDVIQLYEKTSDNPRSEEILIIGNEVIRLFEEKEVDKVTIIHTNYISGLTQNVYIRKLLPLTREAIIDQLEDTGRDEDIVVESKDIDVEIYDDTFIFEPEKNEIVNEVLPKLVNIQLFQAILEAAASEHSSRMIAMKSATDSAGEMIDYLNLEYNKGRQAAITQELAEIVSGSA